MDKFVEQQREHFNRISARYQKARTGLNHQLVKDLIWRHFLGRSPYLSADIRRVLEPMCGMAEGHEIICRYVRPDLEYFGFDYSDSMVALARAQHPELALGHGDVTTFHAVDGSYDLIVLVGGLHHVFSRTRDVLVNLRKSLRTGGYFLSLEPTHDNFLWRWIRQRVYEKNDLFDADTEQGFEYKDLEGHFRAAGFRRVDQVFPGLLAYVLYYNPDAFPLLNVGGKWAVRAAFAFDRLFWDKWIGRKMSFATLSLWARE